jgi:HPt (histidine-containing phosphotransfer) domain-containing protein
VHTVNFPEAAGEIARVRQRFLDRARAETLTVADLCEAVMRAPRARRAALLETITGLLHRLAGTGGTLGFHALGDLARLLERVCLTMLRYPQEGFSARLLELSEGSAELLRIIDCDRPVSATLSQEAPAPPPRNAPDSSLVCVVAQQQSLRRQLHVALEGLGHEVLEFSSCAELAARAGQLEIAAIVVQLEEGQSRPDGAGAAARDAAAPGADRRHRRKRRLPGLPRLGAHLRRRLLRRPAGPAAARGAHPPADRTRARRPAARAAGGRRSRFPRRLWLDPP